MGRWASFQSAGSTGLLKAACALVDAGYRKVNWLRGGIPGWKAKGYPVE